MASAAPLPDRADIDVAADAEKLLSFYDYQKAWLNDDSRFKVGMFSRQTGKSFVVCAELVRDCINAEIEGKRVRWVILSRGERQAKEAMEENVKPMTRAFWVLYRGILKGEAPEVTEKEYRFTREDGKEATYTALEVVFPGGSRISALPANPDTARGFSANLVLDEFAFHQDSKRIWAAAFPVISKGWKVRVVSTPNGKTNKFYELMTEEPSVWSRHIVDIYTAVDQGCPRNIDELKSGLNDNDLWAQEFELKWMDEASAWLDYDLINACETEGYGRIRRIEYTGDVQTICTEAGEALGPARGPVYVGMDIARKVDLTCIWVAERIGDVLYPREIVTMRRAPFRMQHEELKRIEARDHPALYALDQSGMGEPFVESAQEYLGPTRCQGVIFSSPIRFALATSLKEAMEDRKFRLITGQRDIREDLHSITKFVSDTGLVRLKHDGESDGHGDRFWAAALCASAANLPAQLIEYMSAASLPRRDPVFGHRGDYDSDLPGRRFGKGGW